jgi:hypothetical protein
MPVSRIAAARLRAGRSALPEQDLVNNACPAVLTPRGPGCAIGFAVDEIPVTVPKVGG